MPRFSPGVVVSGVVPGFSPGVVVPGVVLGFSPGVAVPGVVLGFSPGVAVNVHVPVTVSLAIPIVTLALSQPLKCHFPWLAASSTSVCPLGLTTTSPVCLSFTAAGAVMLLGKVLSGVPLT